MGQKWIIDVLADLRDFADQNGMPLLAAELRDAARVAMLECAKMTETAVPGHGDDGRDDRGRDRLGYRQVS